jgi:prepilin-type N-terminal cleavage/methylation domain-containing protein/prepilin-type processing-associated H-X9-DG protein
MCQREKAVTHTPIRNKAVYSAKSGFTLIELLVVIAIIAILAAILFPVFARARENARRASCQSGMKQIALGIFQYTQDYDERFPTSPFDQTSYNAGGTYGWADKILPYTKSVQLYQCPSDRSPTANPDGTGGSSYSDYWGNENLIPKYSAGVNVAALTNSSNTVLNYESTGYEGGPAGCYHGEGYGGSAGVVGQKPTTCFSADYPLASSRHLEGSNYSFADGHVKWLKPEKLLPGDTACSGGANSPNGSNATFCKD